MADNLGTVQPTVSTQLYFVAYYPSDASGTAPITVDPAMYDYNSAVSRAKELIANEGNIGVCCIMHATATIVYPKVSPPGSGWN